MLPRHTALLEIGSRRNKDWANVQRSTFNVQHSSKDEARLPVRHQIGSEANPSMNVGRWALKVERLPEPYNSTLIAAILCTCRNHNEVLYRDPLPHSPARSPW
jgi:hypothetical protein